MIMFMPAQSPYASVIVGDYEMDGSTLVKYNGSDRIVTIPNTVLTIAGEAFSGNESIVKVIVPDSVAYIEFAAFENCTSLMQVVLPTGVRTIGSSAFSGCEELQYINIPAKCEKIGSAAFAKCNKLTGITVSKDNPAYTCVDGVLYTKDGSKVVQYLAGRTRSVYSMPSSVEEIEEYAFWGASQLTDISLSSKLKEIPEYAFSNCSGLSNVVLPYRVESLMAYSFADCYSLTDLVVPDSVGYIDENAFYLTNNVKVNYYDAGEAKRRIEEDGQPQEMFSEYVESVSSNAARLSVSGTADEKEQIEELPYVSTDTPDYSDNRVEGELGSGKIIGGNAFVMIPRDVRVRGYDMDSAEYEDSAPVMYSDSYSDDKYVLSGTTLASYSGEEASADLPDVISRIGNRVFYKNDKISEVTMHEGLKSIGDFAFARSSLTRADIPDGVEEIGYAAFYNCSDLNEVTIPDSVKKIELGAFDGTPWLNNMKNDSDGNGFVITGDGILLAYGGTGGDISIPAQVKYIAPGCFEGNTSITGVYLPDGIRSIGEDAFNGCTSLKNIALPDGIEEIEDRAFMDCGFSTVVIPESVEKIGLGTFAHSEDIDCCVVFLGREIPELSYKNTATRLSADRLRIMPFMGTENAIIGEDAVISEGSVLDPETFGFRGQVYSVLQESDSETGTLKLLQADKLPESGTGEVVIDPHVTINDRPYIMAGVKNEAFAPYLSQSEWTDERIERVSINGNTSGQLNDKIAELNDDLSKVMPSAGVTLSDDGDTVADVIFDTTISPDKEAPYASISGREGRFRIEVNRSDNESGGYMNALRRKYQNTDGIIAVPLDIKMYDETTGVPIKRLSGSRVDMEIPIPSALNTAAKINVAALDDNGLVEELSSEIVNSGGNDKIRFVASHFSTFIFYSAPAETQILNEENFGPVRQNAVLRTLNRNMGPLSLKWYISFILLFVAAVLFIYKGKVRT